MLDSTSIRDEYASYLASPSPDIVRRTLDALAVDVSAVLGVARSEDALRAFREQMIGVEGKIHVLFLVYCPDALVVRDVCKNGPANCMCRTA
jgi:hypothetical protein